MKKVVGLDRKLKRIWLDVALDYLGLGGDDKSLRNYMDSQLIESLPSKESRAKVLAIVLRVWSTIPQERIWLRNRAIELLPRISGHERIWLHWGMTALAYPFFRDGAEVIGRLLSLQDDFTTRHVQDRVVAGWGDRTTCKLAARYLLNTLEDWELLRPTESQGHFLPTNKLKSESTELQLWLLEALLTASESNEIEAQQLLRLPEVFPFAITIGLSDLRKSDYLAIHRQGLDMDMVGLNRKSGLPPAIDEEQKEKLPKTGKVKAAKGKVKTERQHTQKKPRRDDEKILRRVITAALRNTDTNTLASRSDRLFRFHEAYERVDGPFDHQLRQCIELYRDGHFEPCRTFASNVIDQMVQPPRKLKANKLTIGSFEKCTSDLVRKRFIDESLKEKLVSARKELDEPTHQSVQAGDSSESAARVMLELLVELDSSLRTDALFK
jgi:hypothetical protein